MKHQAEFDFFRRLLTNYHIACRTIQNYTMDTGDAEHSLELGLGNLLHPGADYLEPMCQFLKDCKPNTVYRIYTRAQCRYFLFELPDAEEVTHVLVGPYLLKPASRQEILEQTELLHLSPEDFPQFEQFYQSIPVTPPDENFLLILVNTLGEQLWGDIDSFSIRDVSSSVFSDFAPVAARSDAQRQEEPLLTMKLLEDRYELENRLIDAVAHGQTHKAEMLLNSVPSEQYEARTTDTIRDMKNYTIVLNTLLRKAAEAGSVHPIHIDSLSSSFARKIEALTSEQAAHELWQEMIHKYCLLVKNYSLQGYSLLVRKVITRIESDLTADLSLSAEAKLLNVNPSYLSTLFKKETGATLTEYVTRKRIEHGVFLLNSTNMQIQAIARYCGIPDVNYFTKIFKKVMGKTPKEYREDVNAIYR